MIRAFIAVDLTDSVRERVSALQERLRSSRADVSWVAPANLHLTLKFLGNIEEDPIGSLKEALGSAAKELKPFSIRLEGIGAFPKTTSPRVLWVGVEAGKEELIGLGHAIHKACCSIGFPEEERPFSPHLTIGRVRSHQETASLIQKLQTAEFSSSEPIPVKEVVLFRSDLSPKGPTYSPLAVLPLGGASL